MHELVADEVQPALAGAPPLEGPPEGERLEPYASALAAGHRVDGEARRTRSLLPQLEENRRQLTAAYQALADALGRGRTVCPAAGRVVENFHVVEYQLQEIREALPQAFFDELPKLADGELAGYPRVHAIARAFVAHTDSRIDTAAIRRFLIAYQRVTPLTSGELWAAAIVLRMELVDVLCRLAAQTLTEWAEREEAEELAERLTLAGGGSRLESLSSFVAGRPVGLGTQGLAHLAARLRERDPAPSSALGWLGEELLRRGESLEGLISLEERRQAAHVATIDHVFASMRMLSTCNWRDLFESVSLVDAALGADPAGVYRLMDFASRDRYRHAVERIGRRARVPETVVAERGVQLAARARREDPQEEARAHVGYYLIDEGAAALEQAFGYRPTAGEALRRAVLRRPTLFYLGSAALLTGLLTAALAGCAYAAGAGWAALALFVLLTLIPASEMALSLLNCALTHLIMPRFLPKIETSEGLPAAARTMVVVPALTASADEVGELLKKIEMHYLANRDAQLYFALLVDFADADAEHAPGDAAILEEAVEGVGTLNTRYAGARFHLFMRRRQWNASEGKWMGWERKRGKLHEFNRLLRGARDTSFNVATADASLLASVRYVITLDCDTRLPPEAARRLVGVALHPLNRPHYDRAAKRVTRGYGILQPRLSITLDNWSRTPFARIRGGQAGLDAYSTASSNVYQDIFAEGNYAGKGLYDVDAFEAALEGVAPENTILSHDLFEGLHARCALVSEVELFDEFPAQYDSHAKRQHRWARGDWQLLPWVLPRVPRAGGGAVRNPLPLISRWKLLDTLRRSLAAQSMFLWLLAVWTFVPGRPLLWTLFVPFSLAFNALFPIAVNLLRFSRRATWETNLRSALGDARNEVAQALFDIACMAHQACLKTDAVARVLYRRLVSRRRLLEWVTAAQAEQSSARSLAAMFGFMWPAPAVAAGAAVIVLLARSEALPAAAPFVIAWALSPLIAWQLSRPSARSPHRLTADESSRLRLFTRRTWSFFETYVGAQDNWLPPDNIQEDPRLLVARRTSPTNIGLLLLSTVAARDFGYVGTVEAAERLGRTLGALDRLEKYRGHLFNWYDTQTLAALPPRYVSTVDSGNLAGHLLAVKQGCLELADAPPLDERTLAGLADTLAVLSDEAARLKASGGRDSRRAAGLLRAAVSAFAAALNSPPPETWSGWRRLLEALEVRDCAVGEALAECPAGDGEFAEVRFWGEALSRQLKGWERDLQMAAPWTFLPASCGALDALTPGLVARWREALDGLDRVGGLRNSKAAYEAAVERLAALAGAGREEGAEAGRPYAAIAGLEALTALVEAGARATGDLLSELMRLAGRCEEVCEAMDFRFLFDPERKVFHIGHNLLTGCTDSAHYDQLASEARLTSFVAVAKGDAPPEHWFRIGRSFTLLGHGPTLISWGGSIFEYLMPLLVMRNCEGTLLGRTHAAAVARHVEYGAEHGVPWGASESLYYARDLEMNYRYSPFGVPELGIRRGLGDDLVVAPYATMLAALVAPRRALANLERLAREGALARHGFYEALDYTPGRRPQGGGGAVVRAYMAHHQGMGLVALDNVLNGGAMQRRFHAEARVRAVELLLQERAPRSVSATLPHAASVDSRRASSAIRARRRVVLVEPDGNIPLAD